jgi:putative tricarboxylic transport membrane protein
MKTIERKWIGRAGVALLAASLAQAGGVARAQEWKPDRPVEMVVGAGAGGGNDNTARTIQKLLHDNQFVPVPVNVVNKPGAGGAIAITYMQQNAGKFNIIGVSSNTLLTNHITKKNAPNPRDVTPLAILINEYISFNVKADSPIKDGKELVAKLKADPASVVLGISSALGNINHIAFAAVAREAGIDPRKVKTVVFNSSSASITALLGGHIDLVVGPVSIAGKRVEAGQIRALGVTAPTRRGGAMAAVPTWKELGLDAVVDNWRGIVGPKDMPREQVAYWDQVFRRMFELEDWKKDLEKNYWDNAALVSGASAKYLDATYKELRRTLTELDLATN